MKTLRQKSQEQIEKVQAWIKLNQKFGDTKIDVSRFRVADDAFHICFPFNNADFMSGASNYLLETIANIDYIKSEYEKEEFKDIIRQLNAVENWNFKYVSGSGFIDVNWEEVESIVNLISDVASRMTEDELQQIQLESHKNMQF